MPKDSPPNETARSSGRWGFELILLSAALAVGLLVLPALIYGVGLALLGAYGQGGGLSEFYGDFFADLATPVGRAWLLACGPALMLYLVRLIFLGARRGTDRTDQDPPIRTTHERAQPSSRRPQEHTRVEPRVTLD